MVVNNIFGKLMDRCAENRLGDVKGFLNESEQRIDTVVNNDYDFNHDTGELVYSIGEGSFTYEFAKDMDTKELRELVVSAAEKVSDKYDPDNFMVEAGDIKYSIEGLVEDKDSVSTPFGRKYMLGKERVEGFMVYSAFESYVDDLEFFPDRF